MPRTRVRLKLLSASFRGMPKGTRISLTLPDGEPNLAILLREAKWERQDTPLPDLPAKPVPPDPAPEPADDGLTLDPVLPPALQEVEPAPAWDKPDKEELMKLKKVELLRKALDLGLSPGKSDWEKLTKSQIIDIILKG